MSKHVCVCGGGGSGLGFDVRWLSLWFQPGNRLGAKSRLVLGVPQCVAVLCLHSTGKLKCTAAVRCLACVNRRTLLGNALLFCALLNAAIAAVTAAAAAVLTVIVSCVCAATGSGKSSQLMGSWRVEATKPAAVAATASAALHSSAGGCVGGPASFWHGAGASLRVGHCQLVVTTAAV